MGFCRRCGDIVPSNATRCRCGGAPVAPTILWNRISQKEKTDDQWTKTYTTPPRSRTNSTPSKSPLVFNGSTSSSNRISRISTSPLREMEKLQDPLNELPSDILASPEDATLAKVYGSMLQPTSELAIHTCARCFTIFDPDATIYPDLSTDSHANSQFLCRSCFVNHGGSKGKCKACSRDVLVVTSEGGFIEFSGRVWHERCFRCENCSIDVSHSPMVDIFGKPSCQGCFDTCTSQSRGLNKTPTKRFVEVTNNLGGTNRGSRESSPALEELSERLGITRPVVVPSNDTNDPFLTKTTTLSEPRSDILTSGGTNSSPTGRIGNRLVGKLSANGNSTINNTTTCKQCSKPLLPRFGGGKFVSAPDENGTHSSYHVQCFRCNICSKSFEGTQSVSFVRNAKGICHPECVESNRGRNRASPLPLRITVPESNPTRDTSKEVRTAPPAPRIFPRFGDSESCPGCQKGVSIMEVGVILGPEGKRWHKLCLVCGGKGAKPPRPGCGKILDSSARLDKEGAVWCRECMLILPMEKRASPSSSPVRNKIAAMYTGQLASHLTGGSSAVARQLTGNAIGLLRSGSISPTRQLRSVSPTKDRSKYPRPIGIRNKSVDEGRGVFLIRQMTGNGQFEYT